MMMAKFISALDIR